MSVTALVSNISRCSVHDGPGVRTVVYLKGCGLRCRWCHNPETLSGSVQILYAPVKCIHCGRCVELCPEHHAVRGDAMVFLRDGCVKCGRCAENCPSGALTGDARIMTAEAVFREIVRDRAYYDATGGGITLSGGECLLQPDFAEELLSLCREAGIRTAVESALFVPWENAERVLPVCDLFLADFKLPVGEKHRLYTGQDNRLILDNLTKLTDRAPGRVLLRIPLIPGVNDSAENMYAFAEKIRSFEAGLQGIELLRHNAMASGKYALAGMEYTSFGDGPQEKEHVKRLTDTLRSGLNGMRVFFEE